MKARIEIAHSDVARLVFTPETPQDIESLKKLVGMTARGFVIWPMPFEYMQGDVKFAVQKQGSDDR